MIKEKSWEEFRNNGLLFLVNQLLHALGWAIILEFEEASLQPTGELKVIRAYPARVKFRGFDEKTTSESYTKLSRYMKDNSDELYEESLE